MDRGQYLSIGAACAGLMMSVAPASAQTATATPDAPPASPQAAPASPKADPVPGQSQPDVDDIIVTATKRGENVQKIPASITALGGAQLASRGLTSVENIAHAIPNLIFGEQAGASMITIRGVGSTIDTGVSEPTVAMYVDGVFLPRATMSLLQAVDLDRVEVLRGPQGTLYGRNATAGAINFISQAPTKDFTGGLTAGTGSRNRFDISGFVSGPITDKILVRLSGGHQQQDGYVKNLLTGQDLANTNNDFFRGAIRLLPTTNLTADFVLRYERDTGRNAFQQPYNPEGILVPPGSPQTTEPNRIYADGPYSMVSRTLVASATLNWTVSDTLSVRSVTGYVDHYSNNKFDGDGSGYALDNVIAFPRPSKSINQEIDLIGQTDKLKWLVGAFYFHEKFFISLPVVFPNGLPGALPPGGIVEQNLHERTNSYAAFADLTYSLTDRLRVNLGLRFNRDEKNFLFTAGATIPGVGFFGVTDLPSKASSSKLLPKAGLQYDLATDVSTYVQWQRGFKSGGHDVSANSLYQPEQLDAYEVGLKSQFFDHKLTANFAGFYYDYKGLQVNDIIPPAQSFIENADAHIYGLEAEFTLRPTPRLLLNAAATFLHARYSRFFSIDDANPGLGTQDLSGRPVNRAPDFTFKASAEYRIPLGSGLFNELALRGDVNHSSTSSLRYFSTPNDVQRGYTLGNISATLTGNNNKTSIRVYLDNVSNKLIKQEILYFGAVGSYMGNYSRPREWGVSISQKF